LITRTGCSTFACTPALSCSIVCRRALAWPAGSLAMSLDPHRDVPLQLTVHAPLRSPVTRFGLDVLFFAR
jgi:hypothetical protein